MRSADLRSSSRRLAWIRAGMVLGLGLLAVRSVHLALVDPRPAQRAADQIVTVLPIAGERGRILDRRGAELAITAPAPSVFATPSLVGDRPATARALARALGADAAWLERRLAHPGHFVYLARWITPEAAQRVLDLELPGIDVTQEPRRHYPYRELAGPVLGFANIDGEGARGVEQQEDPWLRGRKRRVPVQRAGNRRLLSLPGYDQAAHAGGDVRLTLDAVLQADAEAALDRAVAESGARGGFVVAMDPRNGDLLAVAEAPRFDPNHFRDVPYRKTRSRAFLDALEAGSTMKLFVVAAGLEREAVESDELFDCRPGTLRVGGHLVRDTSEHEWLDLGGVVRVSSNIGAARVAQRLGRRAHYEMLERFGFGSVTGSGFPEESAGLMRPWHRWKPIDHVTIAYGQGINVTPVQLAAATSALANEGMWMRPRLVAARRVRGGEWYEIRPEAVRRVLRPEVARRVLAMMTGVVAEGTGRRAAIEGVAVAGKTGTAQRLDPATGRYVERYDPWFVGAVPADDPQLVLAVQLESPRGAHTGGAVAAPLFARVARAELLRRGLLQPQPPEDVRIAEAGSRAVPASVAAAPASSGGDPSAAVSSDTAPRDERPDLNVAHVGDAVLVPDLVGLSRSQVEAMAARGPLAIELSGRGLAVRQEPEPGAIVHGRHERVTVFFSDAEGTS